jgi:hypothetical protein
MVGDPLFRRGDSVLLASTKAQGQVISDADLDGGEYWYTVRFGTRLASYTEQDLEPVPEVEESLESLAFKGRYGKIQASSQGRARAMCKRTLRYESRASSVVNGAKKRMKRVASGWGATEKGGYVRS